MSVAVVNRTWRSSEELDALADVFYDLRRRGRSAMNKENPAGSACWPAGGVENPSNLVGVPEAMVHARAVDRKTNSGGDPCP